MVANKGVSTLENPFTTLRILANTFRFWATASIQKVNDVVKLQALIDRKKVVVTEDIIRQYLRLDDADGVECLPNEEIFVELALRRGLPGTNSVVSWPRLSSALPQFLQVIVNSQVDDLSSHTIKYTSLALTQKVFANMHRVVKGFSKVETPLFATIQNYSSIGDYQAQAEGQEVREEEEIKVFRVEEIKEGGKIKAIDADEDITLVDAETQVDLGAD
nr:hypothetical protein [Tanacetum cinerariifolium]